MDEALPEARKRGRPPKPPSTLPPKMAEFIRALEVTDDRMGSCEKAGVSWGEVKDGLKKYPELMARYSNIMESRNVRLDDVQYIEGKGGNTTAAKAYLQANDPRYRGRGVGSAVEGDDTAAEGSTMGHDATGWLDEKMGGSN